MTRRNIGARSLRRMPGGSVWTPMSYGTSLTGWYRDYPTFTGTQPWVSSSNARTLYHGASGPSSGLFLNGHQTAAFDGAVNSINSDEGSDERMQDYITASAWTCWVLFFADTADAPVGDPRQNAAIFDDSGGTYWQLNYNTNGCVLTQVDSGSKTVTAAASTLDWHLAQCYFDGATLGLRIDSGAWQTISSGDIGNGAWGGAANALRLGDAFTGEHFDGQIAECGIMNISIGQAGLNQVKAYINSRYAVVL